MSSFALKALKLTGIGTRGETKEGRGPGPEGQTPSEWRRAREGGRGSSERPTSTGAGDKLRDRCAPVWAPARCGLERHPPCALRGSSASTPWPGTFILIDQVPPAFGVMLAQRLHVHRPHRVAPPRRPAPTPTRHRKQSLRRCGLRCLRWDTCLPAPAAAGHGVSEALRSTVRGTRRSHAHSPAGPWGGALRVVYQTASELTPPQGESGGVRKSAGFRSVAPFPCARPWRGRFPVVGNARAPGSHVCI